MSSSSRASWSSIRLATGDRTDWHYLTVSCCVPCILFRGHTAAATAPSAHRLGASCRASGNRICLPRRLRWETCRETGWVRSKLFHASDTQLTQKCPNNTVNIVVWFKLPPGTLGFPSHPLIQWPRRARTHIRGTRYSFLGYKRLEFYAVFAALLVRSNHWSLTRACWSPILFLQGPFSYSSIYI